MKTTNWIMMFLFAGLLALPGCGKQKPPTAPVQHGVTDLLPKLRQAFATASPDLQQAVSEVAMGVRYANYRSCLAALNKLARAPGLTEPQQKIVGEVTEQVKQLASKDNTPPAR